MSMVAPKRADISSYLVKMHHEDWLERAKAAHALGQCGLRAALALPRLVKALEDPHELVISAAAHALYALDIDGLDVAAQLRFFINQKRPEHAPRPYQAAWVLEQLEHARQERGRRIV